MDITVKVKDHYPMHVIGELYIDDDFFCYTLEDTLRPPGIKVPEWTGIPRTGMMQHYNVGIRYSPGFDREMLVLYNQPDGETITSTDGSISWKYCMFHGGNDHTNTEGCPLVGYKLANRETEVNYHHKKQTIDEAIVFQSAEKDLFERVAPAVRNGEQVRCFMV